jgi:hypothetical protein
MMHPTGQRTKTENRKYMRLNDRLNRCCMFPIVATIAFARVKFSLTRVKPPSPPLLEALCSANAAATRPQNTTVCSGIGKPGRGRMYRARHSGESSSDSTAARSEGSHE